MRSVPVRCGGSEVPFVDGVPVIRTMGRSVRSGCGCGWCGCWGGLLAGAVSDCSPDFGGDSCGVCGEVAVVVVEPGKVVVAVVQDVGEVGVWVVGS